MTDKPYKPSEEDIQEALLNRKNRAEDYLRDPERAKILVEQAANKAKHSEKKVFVQPEFWGDLKTFFRLLRAYTRREYTAIPWGSIVMVTAAILYFLSPIDLMLDWIPLLGFVDDAAALVFVIRQIRSDLDKFRKWETERTIPPPLIDL